MNNLTQQLKHGAEQAFESLSDGWRELRTRAGEALTRFRSNERHGNDGGGFEDLPAMGRWSFMAADVIEDDDKMIVRLEVPGMRRDDFHVELHGNVLSVRGEKRIDQQTKKGGYQVVQCAYGEFRRQVPLPVAVKADAAKATYRDGVLRIELPKMEDARPGSISVSVH
ncbi:MAG TPA: Hsp20/alpha crystallin family protein [Caldimonas sp.]|jgi:HSP20 family protein|nr:Hsp20/alpha crystallin family protein [Caldimonas sp.]HEX2539670.1 Hsp20/alpha crystallin family protein [Caldimonas sp.]